MQWFRRHIKAGSRLALFALALQFVLSFGHFHVDAAQAVPSIQASVDVAHTGDTGASIPSDREPPASRDNHQSSDEPCAICAVVSMANQIAFGATAALPLPDAVELPLLPPGVELARPGARWTSFRSRAPPLS